MELLSLSRRRDEWMAAASHGGLKKQVGFCFKVATLSTVEPEQVDLYNECLRDMHLSELLCPTYEGGRGSTHSMAERSTALHQLISANRCRQ